MKEIRIYFEGDVALRDGFRAFFGEIREDAAQRRWRMPPPVATNGDPIGDYRKALKSHPESINILLLDSEEPPERESRQRQLADVDNDRVFWMMALMESWFLADRETLKEFYKPDFHEGSLPGNPKVEEIPKKDVEDGLKNATKNTTKGPYHKIKHAPKLLEKIDPGKVQKAAPQCRRLFDVLTRLLDADPR